MFKKDKKETVEWADEKMGQLYNRISDSSTALKKSVYDAYVANLAVNLLPENSPDEKYVKQEADKKRESVRRHIGAYDTDCAEMRMFQREHSQEIQSCWNKPLTSYEIITLELKDIVRWGY